MTAMYLAECDDELTRADSRALAEAGFELNSPRLKITDWWPVTGPLWPFPKVRQGFGLIAEDEDDARLKIRAALGRELQTLRISRVSDN